MILDGMLESFTKQGGKIEFNSQVKLLEINNEVVANSNKQNISSKKVINAAGAHSDRLARTLGVGTEYLCVPFLGKYRKAADKMDSKTLIYPVPHPLNPFLGVHTTLTLDGYIKIGPTAFPTTGREAYKLFQKFNFREFVEILQGQIAIAKGDRHDFIEILRIEVPLLFKHKLVGSAALLSPPIKRVSDWRRQPGGIRSQLVRIDTGELEQDFVVQRHLNSMHYLNLVSPEWTSALPFTRWATGKFLQDEVW
jgi:L-2-hydroxyglutarate oxidase LhgO